MADVSVIMPVERIGGDAERAIAAVLAQRTSRSFELIVVAETEIAGLPADVRQVIVEERNPAVRRNRAAATAAAPILAFIDDDAFAEPDWLETACDYLSLYPETLALGGPDPAPDDSTMAELISDTLLATRYIGSGIACHEGREGTFPVSAPSDVALVNLFVRKGAFDEAGGFDESIGYIGEDSALIERLLRRGPVVYHSAIRVKHRRRAFPAAYLRQRWRYRVKTGELLRKGEAAYRRSGKIYALLGAGVVFAAAMIVAPKVAALMLGGYFVVTLALAIPATRLPAVWWPVIPFAFLAHHATYFLGIVWGMLRSRRAKARRAM
jgi:glycosyltransferase involved in cell wall biosynthesis